nr:vegetative cell wall protein gp1-like [Drosophila suzukii]
MGVRVFGWPVARATPKVPSPAIPPPPSLPSSPVLAGPCLVSAGPTHPAGLSSGDPEDSPWVPPPPISWAPSSSIPSRAPRATSIPASAVATARPRPRTPACCGSRARPAPPSAPPTAPPPVPGGLPPPAVVASAARSPPVPPTDVAPLPPPLADGHAIAPPPPRDILGVAPRKFRSSDVRAGYPIANRRFPEPPLSFFDDGIADHLHVAVGAHRGFWFGVLIAGPLQGPQGPCRAAILLRASDLVTRVLTLVFWIVMLDRRQAPHT